MLIIFPRQATDSQLQQGQEYSPHADATTETALSVPPTPEAATAPKTDNSKDQLYG